MALLTPASCGSFWFCEGVTQMNKLDAYEEEILFAYERGEIKPLPKNQADLDKYRTAATAVPLER